MVAMEIKYTKPAKIKYDTLFLKVKVESIDLETSPQQR